MVLFIWNVTRVSAIAGSVRAGELTATATVLDISDIVQYVVHLKSSSMSQLIKGKSKLFQKLLKYFNGTTISVSNVLLSAGVLPIIFVFYLKDLHVVLLCILYSLVSSLIFIRFIKLPDVIRGVTTRGWAGAAPGALRPPPPSPIIL